MLSFAINPQIKEVMMRQSPSPAGRNTGTRRPASQARIDSSELVTVLRPKSKLLRNQTTIVASNMTVNAFCRKSFAFSQSRNNTFLALGIR